MNTVLLMIVIGGAAYLLMRPGGVLSIGGVRPQQLPSAPVAPINEAIYAAPSSLTPQAISAGIATVGAIGGAVTAGGGAAGTTGAAGAAGGIGTAAAFTAAGIAAGAAVLTWAIISRGLFRGGWEGTKGNELRDAWFQPFIDQYFPGSGSDRQFDAYLRAAADAGLPGDVAERLISAIYAADSDSEWQAATADVSQQFEYYASRRVG
jgi:hypothetical protein